MRVNIGGRGSIPGLGVLAPAYGVEMDKSSVRRMFNFKQFRVYQTSTGLLITPSNIDAMFASNNTVAVTVKPAAKNEPKQVAPVVKETPVAEVVEESAPVVEEVPETIEVPVDEVATLVSESNNDDTTEEAEEIVETNEPVEFVEESEDEVENEEVPTNTTTENNNQFRPNNKKKKRHH